MLASKEQIAAFAALFPNNFRPVQPLNRRFLLRVGG
jgi:carbonic anhydrase